MISIRKNSELKAFTRKYTQKALALFGLQTTEHRKLIIFLGTQALCKTAKQQG